MNSAKPFSVFDSNFVERVLKSEVPVLVDVYSSKFSRDNTIVNYINGLTKRYSGKLRVVKINANDNKLIVQKYKLKNFPTLMLFQDGLKISQSVGANIGKMQEVINRLMVNLSPFPTPAQISF